jgi:hypothetical protein
MHRSETLVGAGPPENRLHSSLGYVPPVEWEHQYHEQHQAALAAQTK